MKLKSFATVLICAFSTLQGATVEDANKAVETGDYREAIDIYQELINQVPKDQQSALKAKLAQVFYRDQEDEKAFKTYLEALDDAPKRTPPTETPEEKKLYAEALRTYLDNTGPAAHEAASKIREKYASILALHPDYYHLNFIVAAAYANLGVFDEFFDKFYRSYQYFPDSFMAYKTKAILNVKIYEKARNAQEREVIGKRVYENAVKANQLNDKDASLYRMMITFAPEQDHDQILVDTIKKVLRDDIVISRTDLMYFVKELVKAKQPELAQQFINKAKGWYPISKILQGAQEYLDDNK